MSFFRRCGSREVEHQDLNIVIPACPESFSRKDSRYPYIGHTQARGTGKGHNISDRYPAAFLKIFLDAPAICPYNDEKDACGIKNNVPETLRISGTPGLNIIDTRNEIKSKSAV